MNLNSPLPINYLPVLFWPNYLLLESCFHPLFSETISVFDKQERVVTFYVGSASMFRAIVAAIISSPPPPPGSRYHIKMTG